jgi:hypothetical protein
MRGRGLIHPQKGHCRSKYERRGSDRAGVNAHRRR